MLLLPPELPRGAYDLPTDHRCCQTVARNMCDPNTNVTQKQSFSSVLLDNMASLSQGRFFFYPFFFFFFFFVFFLR
jgi:hypothetical protein